MTRVDAVANIADMQHMLALWNRTKGQLPGDVMRASVLIVQAEVTVPLAFKSSGPQPAGSRLTDLLPEQFLPCHWANENMVAYRLAAELLIAAWAASRHCSV